MKFTLGILWGGPGVPHAAKGSQGEILLRDPILVPEGELALGILWGPPGVPWGPLAPKGKIYLVCLSLACGSECSCHHGRHHAYSWKHMDSDSPTAPGRQNMAALTEGKR